MKLRLIASIDQIPASDWDRLLPADAADYPFVRHGFLQALEAGGSVGPGTGWHPQHLALYDDGGTLRAAAPLYCKTDSYGEFVFDFAWAQAYRQLGLRYYPKLVASVPFTPVPGPRLLATDEHARHALAQALSGLADESDTSSLHLLFSRQADREAAQAAGAVLRRDCHYHWLNRGYRDFEDFLARLSAKRRKSIRRERRRIAEASITMRVLAPAQVDDALLARFYDFYARTYLVRGQTPYLTRQTLRLLGEQLPDQLRYFAAYHEDRPVAVALMLLDKQTLYGRHWGCLEDYHSLHFETCYYAGIEYCIAHGLRRFDAGAQGEHKVRRGFEPMATYSAHFLPDSPLRHAIQDFVCREAELVADWHRHQRTRSAFPDAAESAP